MRYLNFRLAFFAIAALAISPVLAPVPADAAVKVKEQVSYYKVSGKDGKALSASMISGGGNKIRLTHAVAATETALNFSEPEIEIKNGKCVVKKVDVFLNIKYIFPKWSPSKGTSQEVKSKWAAFYRELKIHESNHGKIARIGAEELEKQLKSLNGYTINGCASFGSFAGAKLKSVIDRTARAQRKFDRIEYGSSSKISKLQRLLYQAK